MLKLQNGAKLKPKAAALSGSGTKEDPFIVTDYNMMHKLLTATVMGHEMDLWYNKNDDVYIRIGADLTSGSIDEDIFICYSATIHIDLAGHTMTRRKEESGACGRFLRQQKGHKDIRRQVLRLQLL